MLGCQRVSDSLSVGVDLGGTKIEGAVLVRRRAAGTGSTETFEVVARTRVPTLADEGYDAVLARTAELVQSVAQQARVDFPFDSRRRRHAGLGDAA